MTKQKFNNRGFIYKILNKKFFVFISNFIVQGLRYMSFGERIYKIFITLISSLIFYLILRYFYMSLLFGHLFNYIFNGQFYVVYRYLSPNRTMRYEDLINFIEIIRKLTKIYKPKDILIIGSFSKGKMGKNSDLDIRLYHNNSFIDSLKAYFMATSLRAYGLFVKFPIDIFCFSDLKFLEKINKDEIPVNFLRDNSFLKKYPKSENYKSHLKKLIIS